MNCYCAFCKTPRRIYRKQNMQAINYIQAISLAAILSFIFWQRLDPRSLVLFVISLMLIEASVLLRRRMDVTCPQCGFDAHLYLKNQEAACEKVKKHLALRLEDPDVWLGKRPPLKMAKRAATSETLKRKAGKSTREIVA